jgi:hypothetical protein
MSYEVCVFLQEKKKRQRERVPGFFFHKKHFYQLPASPTTFGSFMPVAFKCLLAALVTSVAMADILLRTGMHRFTGISLVHDRVSDVLVLVFVCIFFPGSNDVKCVASGRVEVARAPRVAAFDERIHLLNVDQPKEVFLLSFRGPVMPDHKSEVEAVVGHSLTAYLPDHAFQVFTTPSQASRASSLASVAFVGPFQAHHKVVLLSSVVTACDHQFLAG